MANRISHGLLGLFCSGLIFASPVAVEYNAAEPGVIVPVAAVQDTLRPGRGRAEDVSRTFDAIESAILSGDVKRLSSYFGRQMNLNIQGSSAGYYSANQSYYILEHYFSSRKILSFKFTSSKPDDPVPFATGGGMTRIKGANQILQVYVSLAPVDGRLVISQFNIY